jgi:hypothetical protein
VEVADDGGVPHRAHCRCACGTLRWVIITNLVRGYTTSCGCRKREELSAKPHAVKHGLSEHPLYDCWAQMVQRCTNPENRSFKNYGARDIRVYGPWFSVAEFIAWITANLGERPDGCSLDRINNDGHYEPGNVRWSTSSAQARNRRSRWR